MADSWADSMRREAYKRWAEARAQEVERGTPWSAWDYMTNPGNTINRAKTEIVADIFDASHIGSEDPDADRADVLRQAKQRPNDASARSAWDIMATKGLLRGR